MNGMGERAGNLDLAEAALTFRALYGSATDLSVRYEPDTATRYNSVYSLNPSTTYYWRTTWGNGEFRVVVREVSPT